MLPKTCFVIALALALVWPTDHVDGGLHRSIRDVCAGFPWPSDHSWLDLLSPHVTKVPSDGPLKADFDLFKVVRKMPPFIKCIKTLASGEVNTEEQTVAEAWIQDIISGQWWKTYETTVRACTSYKFADSCSSSSFPVHRSSGATAAPLTTSSSPRTCKGLSNSTWHCPMSAGTTGWRLASALVSNKSKPSEVTGSWPFHPDVPSPCPALAPNKTS